MRKSNANVVIETGIVAAVIAIVALWVLNLSWHYREWFREHWIVPAGIGVVMAVAGFVLWADGKRRTEDLESSRRALVDKESR